MQFVHYVLAVASPLLSPHLSVFLHPASGARTRTPLSFSSVLGPDNLMCRTWQEEPTHNKRIHCHREDNGRLATAGVISGVYAHELQ